jgi:hypothetical protein
LLLLLLLTLDRFAPSSIAVASSSVRLLVMVAA